MDDDHDDRPRHDNGDPFEFLTSVQEKVPNVFCIFLEERVPLNAAFL